jgi:hypothetical protein
MNIFQMRHKILERHRGERFTPQRLKAELLNEFPNVNQTSINAADCFNTSGKRAGCTCPECTKLDGFAVNREGVVDMGASGFGGVSPTYVPTRNTRNAPQGCIGDAATGGRGATGGDGILRFAPADAVQYIREYNRSYYRGRSNIGLDREAYTLFKDGMSGDPGRLLEQIAFVGEQYGAAQERFGSIRKEAELIASSFRVKRDKWRECVMKAQPLSQRVPEQEVLDFLFFPFSGTKQWPVWASKTLHFVRPDSFPILDSNAKKPIGLANLANSSRGYRCFCSAFRQVLVANEESLAAARIEDKGEAPTDLKLLDKILFQIGMEMTRKG